MFTGLIETTGSVISLEQSGASGRLTVHARSMTAELKAGESVAVNGCCLTATSVDRENETASFDLLMQTLRVTNLGDLEAGSLVNLERAMAVSARFGGHFVQGHVDATVRLLDWRPHGQDYRLEIGLPPEHHGLVIPKGSICLDGISLTAAEITPSSVVCWIIPHTFANTNLRTRQIGQRLNVEFDMLGKYVRSLMQASTGQLEQHSPPR